jgi:choline dehydrogenase-like flavoprotein
VIDNARVVQGVEVRRSGDFSIKFVRSHQEVVLSAGAINTPHILLRSGVGPRAHLHKHGVSFSATACMFTDIPYGPSQGRSQARAVEGSSLVLY